MMQGHDDQLPRGWQWASLGEIAEIGTGTTPRRGVAKFYDRGTIPWVTSTAVNEPNITAGTEQVTEAALNETRLHLYPKNTLLIALYGEGRTRGTVSELQIEATINQALAAILLRPELADFRPYLKLFLQSHYIELRRNSAGGVQPNLNLSLVRQIRVPVAPAAEQRRIVAKIEELFSGLDAGVAALERVRTNLKRYRAAVLKAAVEGRLTAKWRQEHPPVESASNLLERILIERRQKWEQDQLAKYAAAGKPPPKNWREKYQEPAATDVANLPELPPRWCWATTEQLGHVQLGRQRSPKNRSENYPTKYIRAANITEAGLDLSDLLDMEFEPRELGNYRLLPGDLLLSEASGSPDQVGKPAIWASQVENCCFQNTVIRLRPWRIRPDYLLTVFHHFYANKVFAKVAAGVGINHLSAAKFAKLAVPLPPLDEQVQVAEGVERRLAPLFPAFRYVDASSRRASRLRQSILKLAFDGKLVSQVQTDEPASTLLDRVKRAQLTSAAKSTVQKQRIDRAGRDEKSARECLFSQEG